MGYQSVHSSPGARVWALARRQHGVVSRTQLVSLGIHPQAIKHRLARGRLHRTRWRGVYAVGRPQLSRCGLWLAAVLACGRGAALSHRPAATLWGLGWWQRAIEVTVPWSRNPRAAGVVVHRSMRMGADDLTTLHRIPVTTPVRTLIDLAGCLRAGGAPAITRDDLEAAINEADRRDLVDPETLRTALDARAGEPGVGVLREILDRRTFTLTDSALERRFLPIARRAGLPPPLTQQWLNGHRVDFYWPALELVVETDGLRYHRTPGQQAADRRRDQEHAAAGLTVLRFTHAQVVGEPGQVAATLLAVASARGRAERSHR